MVCVPVSVAFPAGLSVAPANQPQRLSTLLPAVLARYELPAPRPRPAAERVNGPTEVDVRPAPEAAALCQAEA